MQKKQIIVCQYLAETFLQRPDIPLPGPTSRNIIADIIAQLSPKLDHINKVVRLSTGLFMSVPNDSIEADLAFNASRRSDDGKYTSLAAFRETLPSSPAAQLSIALGLGGPMVVFCGDAHGAQALASARRWLESGAIHAAVVVHLQSSQTQIMPLL